MHRWYAPQLGYILDCFIAVCTGYPSSSLVEDGQNLAKHLCSRQAPSKVDESKRRKGEVKVVPGSHPCGVICMGIIN